MVGELGGLRAVLAAQSCSRCSPPNRPLKVATGTPLLVGKPAGPQSPAPPGLTPEASKIPHLPNFTVGCRAWTPGPAGASQRANSLAHNFLPSLRPCHQQPVRSHPPLPAPPPKKPRSSYLRLGGLGGLHQVLLLVESPEANVGQENESRAEEQRHLQKPLLFPLHGQSRAALAAAAASPAPRPSLPAAPRRGPVQRRNFARLTPARPLPGRGWGRGWRPLLPPPRRPPGSSWSGRRPDTER